MRKIQIHRIIDVRQTYINGMDDDDDYIGEYSE